METPKGKQPTAKDNSSKRTSDGLRAPESGLLKTGALL